MDLKSKKLEDLEKKIEQLKAQAAAETAKLKAKAKKEDTRRKILVGAYYLQKAEEAGTMPSLVKQLDPFLTRKADRALFNLPAKSPAQTDTVPNKS